MKHLMTLFGLCCLPLLAQAGPQINVGVVYDYLDGEKSTYLKRVFNGGDATAFVKVNILEIVYDADGKPQEVPVKNQAEVVARDGLMASPARLIVPANGMQGTRLLYMGEREHERYFRVRFLPVVPEQEDQFAVSSEEREEYKKELSAGVNILAGYGTIFFVRPKHTRFDTKIDNSKEHYTLRNNGNSVVIVDQFKDCSSKNERECNPVTKHHILAGREFKFDKQAGREYRFKLVEGEKKKTIEVKGLIPAPRTGEGALKSQVFAMFKTLTTTVLLLTSTWALAAREEHVFEVSVRIPTLQFYVTPTDPGWMHKEQELQWDVRTSTLGSLRKEFDVLNDGGAVSAKLVAPPYLSNGNAPDNIQLKVKFNGVVLDAQAYHQVVSAQEAKVGSRVPLEIIPQMTAGGYKPGAYNGNVNMIFNAAAPGG